MQVVTEKHLKFNFLQGPSLSRCAETQEGTNYCHPGCGSDVCVQPGTIPDKLREYLDQSPGRPVKRIGVVLCGGNQDLNKIPWMLQ